ncbi:MBL fold metallo-hydrolase [Vogesella sp. LIG4]|uniref:MBL fold metallo-hydrolase n=1 Tax=Vogesella sp. LIG4 TaxID=1192162 RepID=UPI00081FA01D|nr:MBL fold metallo-hydrolase [Vogesella sp. LIG4]SCK11878.1 Glyoxylase, beta-lactamase superfamily II [Vogesella sp. LIG4]
MHASIQAFFDPVTGTYSYVVFDHPGGHAAIIDPVLDYDPKAGRTATDNAQQLVDFITARELQLAWILETHAHADHLTAAAWLKQRLGGRTGIGRHIDAVQRVFKPIFQMEEDFATDGRQFDQLFADGDSLQLGELTLRVLALPGHTPADVGYQVGDDVFIGDTLFQPDVGSARCDFPGGDARTLFHSVQRLLSLPDNTRLWLCHDYPPDSRAPSACSTVAEQKAANVHVRSGVSEADFVALRQARDATLGAPVLLIPSIQVNIRAGNLPPPAANGHAYLKIPLDLL